MNHRTECVSTPLLARPYSCRVTFTQAVLGFAALSVLIVILPGADTALVLRYALGQSRRHAFVTALGMCCGGLVWGIAAATGVSALLALSTVAYDVLRILGGAYLVFLAVTFWRSSFHADPAVVLDGHAGRLEPLGRTWTKGFVSNLLNPKYGMFCLAVIPQFLVPGVPPVVMGIVLALVNNLEGLIWFTLLITAAHSFRRWLQGPVFRRWLDRVTGTALGVFGVVAIVEGIRGVR